MAQKVLGFDDVALLIEDINEDTEYLKNQVDGKAPLTHGHNAFDVTFDDGKTLPEKLDEVAGGGQIDLTDYVKKEVGKGLSTNDYDNVDKGKVDKLGTATLTTNAKTAFEAINELDDTIKDLPYTRTTIHDEVTLDANQWLTDGYTKTNAQTLNLPDDLATGERAGILFFMSENKDDPTGIQLFYCMQQQGDVLNKIYSRVVSNMNTNPNMTPWGKKLSPKDLEVYQKVIDNTLMTIDKTVPGSINELNDKKVDNTDAVISNSLSMGRKAGTVIGTKSVAIGTEVTASGIGSVGIGNNVLATGSHSFAFGDNSTASGDYSIAFGRDNTSTGVGAWAEGRLCKALQEGAHAEGGGSQATGFYSHAEGSYTVASGLQSHAEGGECKASGTNSHAEGFQTEATKVQSHAEGHQSQANGNNSHAEGDSTVAEGINSHAEGAGSQATGETSHAEGIATQATGPYSHAEGMMSTASGTVSHAEGSSTQATGDNSHAEGISTTASGTYSHSEGSQTQAKGSGSHAEGISTIATGECQHVEGKFNIEDTANRYLHIIGNGTNAANRANAHTVDRNGNAWYKGDVYVGNVGQDTGNKLLSTADIRFNASGKLVVTINGVTKTFNPA